MNVKVAGKIATLRITTMLLSAKSRCGKRRCCSCGRNRAPENDDAVPAGEIAKVAQRIAFLQTMSLMLRDRALLRQMALALLTGPIVNLQNDLTVLPASL
ncbi:MAG TPA: hypothetical protein VGN76_16465 [Gemmatimonadales bacterium]|jgi:hypothetical protein|nr:hypothetical protein [Gemmatimonadales bacterium]